MMMLYFLLFGAEDTPRTIHFVKDNGTVSSGGSQARETLKKVCRSLEEKVSKLSLPDSDLKNQYEKEKSRFLLQQEKEKKSVLNFMNFLSKKWPAYPHSCGEYFNVNSSNVPSVCKEYINVASEIQKKSEALFEELNQLKATYENNKIDALKNEIENKEKKLVELNKQYFFYPLGFHNMNARGAAFTLERTLSSQGDRREIFTSPDLDHETQRVARVTGELPDASRKVTSTKKYDSTLVLHY